MNTRGFYDKVSSLIILNGAVVSNAVFAKEIQAAWCVGITAPSNFNSTTGHTIEVTHDPTGASGWCTLENSGGTVGLPSAVSKARIYTELMGFAAFRIRSTVAASADTTWLVGQNWTA